MSTIQTAWSKRNKSTRVAGESGIVVCDTFEYDFVAASFPVLNDIIEMGELPGYSKVVDMILDTDDIDDAAGLVLDVGIMDGTFGDATSVRTCGNEFFDGSTLGQAGGVARMTLQTGFNVDSIPDVGRGIGVKIATAAGTPGTGTLRLKVFHIQD